MNSSAHTRGEPFALDTDRAADILKAHWDIAGDLTDLGSLQDSVMKVRQANGNVSVLKVSPAIGEAGISAENAALLHVAEECSALSVPVPLPTVDGHTEAVTADTVSRLMTWVDGTPMNEVTYFNAATLRGLGKTAASIADALQHFEHRGLHEGSEWDPRNAVQTLTKYSRLLSGTDRELALRTLRQLEESSLFAEGTGLPEQAVHSDVTDFNCLGTTGDNGEFEILSLIDFGDLTWSWRISEVVAPAHVAISRDREDPLGAVLHVLKGFTEVVQLTAIEIDELWVAIVARAGVCAAIEIVESREDPDNDYASRLAELDRLVLESVLMIDPKIARAVLREACGFPAFPTDLTQLVTSAGPAHIFGDRQDAAHPKTRIDMNGYGNVSFFDGAAADAANPKSLQVGGILTNSAGKPCYSPFEGTVLEVSSDRIVVKHVISANEVSTDLYLTIEGIAPAVISGANVTRGQRIGVFTRSETLTDSALRSRVLLSAIETMDFYGRERERSALLALCPDPRLLQWAPTVKETYDPDTAQDLRIRYVSGAQQMYYSTPFQAVQGRGQWLYDAAGRRYLDMVNNIAVVGHSHPRVTEAATKQLEQINTNSRFLYRAMGEYAERIAKTLPTELQSIFFVNSGSEAVDLALRLARFYTKRQDVAVIDASYHGWTSATFDLSTMPIDRPDGQDSLAPYIHVVEAPDSYRGVHGSDANGYLESVERACTNAQRQGGLAAFVCEPLLGNHGGLELPDGYLSGAYKLVRKAGGVCIADEIQVGYGRSGAGFWSHEGENAVPDILVSAKSAGNGFPIGFVACRPEIAEVFEKNTSFFSSTGGAPVSCAVGAEVLDIIKDEQLQSNALHVGAYLKKQIEDLTVEHPEIGGVHGRGLYLGIDLIIDPKTKEPAVELANLVCERMRELGVIIQPTGVWHNVLKVKPPLCVTYADVDRFVERLQRALTDVSIFV